MRTAIIIFVLTLMFTGCVGVGSPQPDRIATVILTDGTKYVYNDAAKLRTNGEWVSVTSNFQTVATFPADIVKTAYIEYRTPGG